MYVFNRRYSSPHLLLQFSIALVEFVTSALYILDTTLHSLGISSTLQMANF